MVCRGCRLCKVLWHVSSTGTKFMQARVNMCAHQLSERAHASIPCLSINHKTLETNKHVVVEPCNRWRRCPVGLWGEMEVLCWALASPYFVVQEPPQTCTPCFHTSSPSLPHPGFCYEISMVCALMACYMLESSECGSSGQIFVRAWAFSW
jgi:hypothetical protein